MGVQKLYILPANKKERDFLYNMCGEIDNPKLSALCVLQPADR